jgi:co-chaperonin GroES (HSP10)
VRIKPLSGNVLIELDAPDRSTASGIVIADYTNSAEDNQVAARMPEKPPCVVGTVREIGAWPKTKRGLLAMPEFGVGAKVILPHGAGIHMRCFQERFRMVYQHEVLAVIS